MRPKKETSGQAPPLLERHAPLAMPSLLHAVYIERLDTILASSH